MMRLATIALLLLSSVVMTTVAYADDDDKKWIAQCLADNAAGAAPEVVAKYCKCMNDKMDSSEAQSITKWEANHPKEKADCDKESGWK
ncbi:Lipoprotein [uncultured Gammaproteobacteria bacterium]